MQRITVALLNAGSVMGHRHRSLESSWMVYTTWV